MQLEANASTDPDASTDTVPTVNVILKADGVGTLEALQNVVKNVGSMTSDVAINVKYDNAFGFATQLGIDFKLSEKYFVNLDAKYILLKTDVNVDASNLAPNLSIPAKVDINPFLLGFGVGMKF
jgi:outer membrane protein W